MKVLDHDQIVGQVGSLYQFGVSTGGKMFSFISF